MSSGDEASRPVPHVAYQRWLDALARAGWPGPAGLPGDGSWTGHRDLVPVGEALGRVATTPVVARWPSPRISCAAMDGIAVRAADLAAAHGATDEIGRAHV